MIMKKVNAMTLLGWLMIPMLAACGGSGSTDTVVVADPLLLLITFSGESDKPGVTAPINNVYGITVSGGMVPDLLDTDSPNAPTLNELRGLAIGDGDLYVADANKSDSKVLRYRYSGASPPFPFVDIFATSAATAGLMHPYQPDFDDEGNLYVTSQHTYVVTKFYPDGTVPEGASPWLQEEYGKSYGFYDGTWAPGAEKSKAPQSAEGSRIQPGRPPFATGHRCGGGA